MRYDVTLQSISLYDNRQGANYWKFFMAASFFNCKNVANLRIRNILGETHLEIHKLEQLNTAL